ncbi:pyrroline-5-carboxylate reductase [Thamnocephalis sphaerospora]|uniref:Pyrroline-5-carboxylate reductase n=1 Tax=Thamnocephalis sphaerospora TaxID=78915 RepID=A0A4P9XV17_9FUNG|nr:pyrroline-5-carboxylate reductase [Thamnocephalis sphaerospora]|eukprot:RKP10104.1 pyrroline-5-carboxylate reductase [Thamnocephalis sphaerospora]
MTQEATQNGQQLHPRITFIGGGNMAEAILAGLLRKGHPTDRLVVSEPMPERQTYLREHYPELAVHSDNTVASADAELIVLAVKPGVVPAVLAGIRDIVARNQAVLLSIAAGVRLTDMEQWLRGDDHATLQPAIVRCMPNTPALVGHGATGLYANANASPKQRAAVETVLRAVSGALCWVTEESQLDAVTAVSGSGPAYFFLLMEAMEEAGVQAGLPRDIAAKLTAQTALGAAHMALQSDDNTAELRRKVTSPNGTTYAAITHMENGNVPETLRAAVRAAADRSAELGEELGRSKM